LQLWHEIGDVVHDPADYATHGRPKVLTEIACKYMTKLLDRNSDLYLDEIVLGLSKMLGINPALSTIHKPLELLGYSMKKVH
ncbi:hypothetical protein M422DRAFT_155649, partial [Sphaerobolus stellatus SS14]